MKFSMLCDTGAMENWGLIIHNRWTLLLLNETEKGWYHEGMEQQVCSYVAHEVSPCDEKGV